MKYFVQVGGAEHVVLIDGESVTIDETTVRAHLEEIPGTPLLAVIVGTESHRVIATRGLARGQYDLSVAGHRFAVDALDERSRVILELAGKSASIVRRPNLFAPMPGLIVRVAVSEGDRVRAGQGLVVMEAMKMENELRAAADGTVKRVVVAPGSAVEKGALLLELE